MSYVNALFFFHNPKDGRVMSTDEFGEIKRFANDEFLGGTSIFKRHKNTPVIHNVNSTRPHVYNNSNYTSPVYFLENWGPSRFYGLLKVVNQMNKRKNRHDKDFTTFAGDISAVSHGMIKEPGGHHTLHGSKQLPKHPNPKIVNIDRLLHHSENRDIIRQLKDKLWPSETDHQIDWYLNAQGVYLSQQARHVSVVSRNEVKWPHARPSDVRLRGFVS
jgi:hypothetical protein